ncbi:MAG: PRC-barrel domain-containing protein [Proteobacteria bacterium]|nr:PRC-barrel domain-containing protein [Pseudomonadota bacterium]
MLRRINEIIGYTLFAKENEVGKCKDLLFDDQLWTVRHMVADTGGWLVGQKVLVSPVMVQKTDWQMQSIFLDITREQLEKCPFLLEDEPVSREHERKMFQYIDHPYYWLNDGLWDHSEYPAVRTHVPEESAQKADEEILKEIEEPDREENHLRSYKEVKGYKIEASDGNIGHVEDFILEDKTWALRYVVVDTRNWLPGGKKVLLSLNWVKKVNWELSTLFLDISKEQAENSPEFDPEQPVNIEYETRLYDYYGRPFEKNITKKLQKMIANPFI